MLYYDPMYMNKETYQHHSHRLSSLVIMEVPETVPERLHFEPEAVKSILSGVERHKSVLLSKQNTKAIWKNTMAIWYTEWPEGC